MIGYMISQNVLHRPLRTFITVLAVAVEVTLVIIVVGLTSGLLMESAKRTEGVGADIMVQPPSASIFMAFGGAPMPIAIGDKLHQLDYVQAVAPVLVQFNSVNGLDIVYGIDPATFSAVSGGFVLHGGHELQDPNDILIDDVYALSKKVKVGQTLHILEHDFHVAGIVEHGKGARLFVLMPTLQEMAGAHDKASVFYVKCDRSDHTLAVMDEIRELLPKYEIRPLKDFISLMTSSNLPGLSAFINVMIGIAVAIGFLVIFLSMYTTIIERTREIGVLKSLGASKGYIVQIVLSETTLLCLAGVLGGVGLSFLMRSVFIRLFPSLTILITLGWIA
ncbi:MAG: ABC transporter permease, partial [Candidatus Acidiferrales bacterium]